MKKVNIDNRIQTGEYVGSDIYTNGLLVIVQYLFLDLSDLLENEGRRFGIVISYLDSVYQTCKKLDLSPDNQTSSKIIYLYKPLIIAEFKRLCKKKVSRADSVIVLIKTILEIVKNVPDYEHAKEAGTLLKIITKLFDNIKNNAKFTDLSYMIETITENLEQGKVGKYVIEKFSILEEEEKRERKQLVGSGIRVRKEQSKILEVTWKEE